MKGCKMNIYLTKLLFLIFYSRFPTYDSMENLIATALHPFFKKQKTVCLFPQAHFNEIQNSLLAYLNDFDDDENLSNTESSTQSQRKSDNSRLQNFFGSTFSSFPSNSQNFSNDQVLKDFFDDNETSLLIYENKKYEKLRRLFIDLNTKIPSSAAVERLFSTAKKIWTFDRPNMSDKLLERTIFLKSNLFWEE